MLTVALQQGINGIVVGSLYVLVALGLTLIYGVLVQINFAHADVVTIGAFAAYFFTFVFGGNYLVSIGIALMVGAALGCMGGAMLGPILVLTPFAGTSVIVKAFAIVIIGGFGNVEGTIIAGLAVGLIESFTTQLVNPGLTDLVVFTLLLLMLAFRPTGLIAEKREENV